MGIGIGAAAFIFPGLWLYGAYHYDYANRYSFRNATNTTQSGQNETLPVTCLCQQYSACGCDDNDDRAYLDSIVGNGSIAAMNSSLVHVGPVNDTKTIVLNGTLPNGTDTSSTTSTATRRLWLEASGIWMVGGIVAATVWLL